MWHASFDRISVAERIAETEDRVAKLRERADRLRAEGSDATQAEELLSVARTMLGYLHARQSGLRQRTWTISQ
jgi:hypothetical protein